MRWVGGGETNLAYGSFACGRIREHGRVGLAFTMLTGRGYAGHFKARLPKKLAEEAVIAAVIVAGSEAFGGSAAFARALERRHFCGLALIIGRPAARAHARERRGVCVCVCMRVFV